MKRKISSCALSMRVLYNNSLFLSISRFFSCYLMLSLVFSFFHLQTSCLSFLNAFASSCRARSRVTQSCSAISVSVFPSPKRIFSTFRSLGDKISRLSFAIFMHCLLVCIRQNIFPFIITFIVWINEPSEPVA